jgi:uncharacterized protein (TIGR03435 family)
MDRFRKIRYCRQSRRNGRPGRPGTGLKGSFDFTLDPLEFSDHTQPITPASWPDLVLTAVREQLGFKLEKQKASLEITVIDHAEEPTDN